MDSAEQPKRLVNSVAEHKNFTGHLLRSRGWSSGGRCSDHLYRVRAGQRMRERNRVLGG